MTNSQESLANAHGMLENDPAIDDLISNMFNDVEGSDMANYWIDFMTMVEILMMNVHAITAQIGGFPSSKLACILKNT